MPDVAEGQGGPEHFSVVKCRHSALEIVSGIDSFLSDCDPRQEPSKARISLVEILQGSCLQLNQSEHIEWLIDLINELSAVQHECHNAQMNTLLATRSELMQ